MLYRIGFVGFIGFIGFVVGGRFVAGVGRYRMYNPALSFFTADEVHDDERVCVPFFEIIDADEEVMVAG